MTSVGRLGRGLAAALGVVGQDDRGDDEGHDHGEEPGRVIDEFGGERCLEGGEKKAEPGQLALSISEETGRTHSDSLARNGLIAVTRSADSALSDRAPSIASPSLNHRVSAGHRAGVDGL